tara:strand:- start:929 stop:1447 length:519 start_codon:yes stop_codon:yes gene_type:complete
MKIDQIMTLPKKSQDTTSCGTTYSGQNGDQPQDIVSQNIVPETIDGHIVEHSDHSAIAEGVSQILRRQKGKGLKTGFRCTSGPRKGRIVAKPSTCFMKRDPVKGAKIAKKRQLKAKQAGKKLAVTKRSRPTSQRLKGVQLKTKATGRGGKGSAPLGGSKKGFQKSKVIRPRK